jgi:hypothetical protein
MDPPYFEKLTEKQQAELKKCGDERLRARLMAPGMEEEAVFSMDRKALLEAAAQVKVLGEGATGGGGKSVSMWEREMLLREKELQWKQEKEKRRLEEREIEEKQKREQRESEEKRRQEEKEIEDKRRREEKEI